MAKITVDIDKTRMEIRLQFTRWDIDQSEWEIVYQEDRSSGRILKQPGATIRYMRGGNWQEISCYGFPSRAQNLRQCFFLLERLRIAEQNGVQYQGLTFTKDLATSVNTEAARKESLMDSYDILGASPDDPINLIKDIYRRKTMYYHPDKGGNPEKFKRLTEAYEFILKTRGEK